MPRELDPNLRQIILDKVYTFRPEDLREAVRLAEMLPPPADPPQDDVAQLLHDIALHVESISEWSVCTDLYLRSLEYPVRDVRIHAGSKFRLAVCLESEGDLRQAVKTYREALSYGEIWPEVSAHTCFRLAMLLIAAEEYQEALEHLLPLDERPLPVEVSADKVHLSLCRCLVRLSRFEEAEVRLKALCRCNQPEVQIEALQLLAFVYEQRQDKASAGNCYRLLVEASPSNPTVQRLALHRLANLT